MYSLEKPEFLGAKVTQCTLFQDRRHYFLFSSRSLKKIGKNERDNGKLVMRSSLNHFHFEALFFFKLTSQVCCFFLGQRIDPERRMTKSTNQNVIWAFFKNMLITGKGKENYLRKNQSVVNVTFLIIILSFGLTHSYVQY